MSQIFGLLRRRDEERSEHIMKIAVIIVRLLMGLLFLFASLAYFFNLVPQPELKGGPKLFMEGIVATRYFLPLLKTTELVCALAFLSGRFVPLATVVLFPITLNILLYHLSLLPEGVPLGIFILLGNLFLAFACRAHYKSLLAAKIMPPLSQTKDISRQGSVEHPAGAAAN
jgi:putative oxidoreductase